MEFSVYDYRPGAQKGDVLRLVISINNLLVQMAIRCTSPTRPPGPVGPSIPGKFYLEVVQS